MKKSRHPLVFYRQYPAACIDIRYTILIQSKNSFYDGALLFYLNTGYISKTPEDISLIDI